MTDFYCHPALEAASRDRGITDEAIEKVCSGNWSRVFRPERAR